MALSPEDVIKKSFSATHLRRGYDETQVDDFLDEVVIELRRLLAENEGLRTDLQDCRAGRGGDTTGTPQQADHQVSDDAPEASDADDQLAELRRQLEECQEARAEAENRARAAEERAGASGGDPGADGEGSAPAELEDLRAQVAAADARAADLQEQLTAAQERAEAAEQGDAELAGMHADGGDADSEDASAIISLAQRLHDQHVAEGESTKARLVEEGDTYRTEVVTEADQRRAELERTGQETHDRLVADGQAQHGELVRTGEQTRDQLIHEAEQRRAEVLEDLNRKQAALAGKIKDLQTQETDLRLRLRTFLTDQMEKLDASQD